MLRINREALEGALQFHLDEGYHVLDRESGEVFMVSHHPREAEDKRLTAMVAADEERYLSVPAIPPANRYRWMRDFAERNTEGYLYDQLALAMQGRGGVRRFLSALSDYPREQQAWHQYQESQVREYAEEWLRSFEISYEFC